MQHYLAVFKCAYSEFGTLRIEHDGKGNLHFVAHPFYCIHLFKMLFVRSVRKVEPCDIHARLNHLGKNFLAFAGGTQSAYNFGFFHITNS